jgi:hypothetical protein
MKPSTDNFVGVTGKLSHLIRVGSIVYSVDGSMYRCTSKLASGGSVSRFQLTDLQGKPVKVIQPGWKPISPALARFASWMRWVVAYNKDFDLYVKEYIAAAGLPIDPTMNWSRFFSARIAPKLMSRDPEVQDEAIHHIIINALAERSILENFKDAIKKFPAHIRELPLERQVTTFLMQNFNWRIAEANRYIQQFIFQENTSSMWQEVGEGEPDVNLLDADQYRHKRPNEYNAVDADADVLTFRRGFESYLSKKYRDETVIQYLSIFDLLYAHLREGDIPKGTDLWAEWKEGIGADKSPAWFKILFANLPKLIDTYVTKELGGEEVNPFIEVMQNIGGAWKYQNRNKQELQPIHAAFGGLKLAEEFPINHEIESTPPESNNDSGSGGNIPPLGDLAAPAAEAEEAAGGAGEALEALAPLALAASKAAAQWEVPKCKSCGTAEGPTDCPACHEKFCGDCLLNHHANNPSHDRVASTKKANTAPEGYQSGYRSGQTDRNMGNQMLEINKHPGASEYSKAYCQGYYDGYHNLSKSKNPYLASKRAAMDSEDRAFREMDTALDIKSIIEDVIGSGLFEAEGEPYFSWDGCDYCNGGGGDITDYKGYRNLEDAQAANREEREYEFKLCGECLNTLYYGDVH